MNIPARLRALRTVMTAHQIDAYLVLSSDPHLSEYLPEHWQSRAWLSGFEGSAGTLLVTAHEAGLWTDSRYWAQAEQSLQGSGINLFKQGAADVPGPTEFLQQQLPKGAVLCIDAQVMPLSDFESWQHIAADAGWHIQTQDILLDAIWAERPALPHAPIYAHDARFIGRSRTDNLHLIRQEMDEVGAQWHLLSSLDDIAWVLGLRGADVDYNPVFLSHLLLGKDRGWLFVAPDKLDANIEQALAADGIEVRPYEQLAEYLAQIPKQQRLCFDPHKVTAGILAPARHAQWHEMSNPSTWLKACKNEIEQAHIRQTMVQDGIALCEFYAWLEKTLAERAVSELEVDEQLTAARARRPGFISPSFATIAGFNANGAMPHYQATADQYSWIEGDGLLLIDSGGQYLGGTTDITRVTPVGQISAAQKRDYTLVLRAMIALSEAVFPRGATGQNLDAIARLPLWQAHLDYGHGTGHGVGYFLNVHEGPQNISWRQRPGRAAVALAPGMVTSNEPALYREGQWGIRIENLILTQKATENEFGDFYRFETLTLCPIDVRCVEVALLNTQERRWLNDYHARVREELAPHLNQDALQWLLARTEPI
ncbi:MAG TPA: aminopeptidase P family protein [Paenalcaligenes sp.]|nr:aminopeptidase P family protein [Paenalcaligenes sp.]